MAGISAELSRMLRTAAWTRGLSPEQLLGVEDELREKRFAARTVVCREGASAEQWIGVVEGLVKVESVDADGRLTTVMVVATGGWLDGSSLIRGERLRHDVVTLSPSRICFVPRATFVRLLTSSLPFNHFVIEQLSARLRQFVVLTETHRRRDTVARLAHCMAELFDPQLNPVLDRDLRLSQQEIGHLCGFSRQVAGRALRRLEEAGLVHVHHGGVNVLDVSGLKQFVQMH